MNVWCGNESKHCENMSIATKRAELATNPQFLQHLTRLAERPRAHQSQDEIIELLAQPDTTDQEPETTSTV